MRSGTKRDTSVSTLPARGRSGCHLLLETCITGNERPMFKKLVYLGLIGPLFVQEALSLRDAVRVALEHNKSMAAVTERRSAAAAHVRQANGGWLPRLNYAETWTRSDNPVF